MVLRIRVLIPLICLLGAAADASAQTKVGTTIAQFMGIEPSAQHTGFGNAGAALATGIESVYFNPGVIGLLWETEIQFTHAAWYADIAYDYAAIAVPVRRWGTLFSSVTALNSGDIAVRTVEKPLGTGEDYSVGNTAIGLGFGRQVDAPLRGWAARELHQRAHLAYLPAHADRGYRHRLRHPREWATDGLQPQQRRHHLPLSRP